MSVIQKFIATTNTTQQQRASTNQQNKQTSKSPSPPASHIAKKVGGANRSPSNSKNVPCNARSLSACVRKRSNVTEERAVLMQRGSSNSRARHVDRNSAYYDDDCQLPSPTAASWDYVLECECGALDCSEAPRATSVCER